jgi:hypothetical protein
MDYINLTKEFFIAKGGERECYIHPKDNSKVVKIIHRKGKNNEQNQLEYKYTNFLKSKNRSFEHITKCYGFVDTNLGKGLVFDRVFDYTNEQSKSFKEYVLNSSLPIDTEKKLIEELKNYIFSNDILFIDVDLSNLFCKEYEKGKYKLIIIDGLGARRIGFRFSLYLKSKIFTKYKMKKQWKKFWQNYLKYSFQRNK